MDRYYKRFKTYDHLIAMRYGILSEVSLLRELSAILLVCEGPIGQLNLKYLPKLSTLSDANEKLNSELKEQKKNGNVN